VSDMPGLPGLVPYYEWVAVNLPLPSGKVRSRRSAQSLAKKLGLPLVRIGLCAFLDLERASAVLRENQQPPDRTPRRPGRPPGATNGAP
jgi:hypothetical protein